MTMAFLAAALGFGLFLFFYALAASAVVYHLNAFSLPGWTGRRVSIAVFVILSAILAGLAVIFFFQVPWDTIGLKFYP